MVFFFTKETCQNLVFHHVVVEPKFQSFLIDIFKIRINGTGGKQLKFKIDAFFDSLLQ